MSDTNVQVQNLLVINQYFTSLAQGDMGAFASLFSESVVWHQPGGNKFSGSKNGFAAVGEMVGGMMADSQGSLVVKPDGAPMANDDLVSAPILFSATKNFDGTEKKVEMTGSDLFKIKNGKIVEVWLFSSDQDAEDAFWGL
ncbi:nuclear transport factor 2 family protein [Grimontia marina]|uniref:SnoaL-like domain protein n=1 Tax=Grimontia marina TaxID=646534 RepID=A0A128F7L2_9GAMM|nr:nuclear transport factor 2 family protein [Grimontia marina]CZF82772.1 SnoaL-like domain protein [Grimontia marina]